jgi:hypothetical protein
MAPGRESTNSLHARDFVIAPRSAVTYNSKVSRGSTRIKAADHADLWIKEGTGIEWH